MAAYKDQVNQNRTLAKELGKEIPDTMQAMGGLHKAAFADGTLDTKTKELIALAIGVSTRCEGCIAAHTKAAVNAGANRKELAEALGVTMMMGGGPSWVYAAKAWEAVNEFLPE